MIAYLRGQVVFIDEESCVLDVGGVGYHVYCSQKTIQELKKLSERGEIPVATLYTRLIHRDESMDLYGFVQREECVLFNLLNTVSGIGPKQSLRILGARDAQDLVKAVVSEDSTFLMSLAGIGNKKAQQIILELKEKVKKSFDTEITPVSSIYIEALSALQSLGFTLVESRRAVEQALNSYGESLDVGIIVEAALKLLS
jgi:Holliday junction DNA helicase RuvA